MCPDSVSGVAAQNGHREVVAALVEAGADVNATDEDDHTPLLGL